MDNVKFSTRSDKLTDEKIAKLRKASIWVAVVGWILGTLMAIWTISPFTLYRDFANLKNDNQWMLPSAAISMAVIAGSWFLVVQIWLSKKPAGTINEVTRGILKTIVWSGIAVFVFFVFIALASFGFMGGLGFGLFGFLLTTPMNLFPLFGFSVAKRIAQNR